MSLTNPNTPISQQDLQDFYHKLLPYISGGESYTAGDGIEISNDVISTDNLQSGDMDDIVTPIPSIPTRVPHKYSTTEQIVGEWIDGSPVYEKTVNFGALPNKTMKTVSAGISNLDYLISMEALGFSSGWGIPIPNAHPEVLGNAIYMDFDNGLIRVFTNSDKSSVTNCYVTLRYTKTTT